MLDQFDAVQFSFFVVQYICSSLKSVTELCGVGTRRMNEGSTLEQRSFDYFVPVDLKTRLVSIVLSIITLY